MKKHLFISLSLIVALSGCSTNEEVERADFKALSFETFIGKGTTRAVSKLAFADGDDFGVVAYKHGTASWASGITKELFMENVKVARQSGSWTYAPVKYWEEGVKHTFLAYSPYHDNYMLNPDGHLIGIVTQAAASAQEDLLYSIPDAGSKDLEWTEGRQVVMNFRHALSQIRISASTAQDYSGYYVAKVREVRLAGIADTGNLNLDVADASASPWSEQGSTVAAPGVYTATTGSINVPLTTAETLLNPDAGLFMQIPQIVAEGTATFEIIYDIEPTEAGDITNAGTSKSTIIKVPPVSWEHNRIYHYKINMDLQQLLNLKSIEVGEPDVVMWEAGQGTKLPEDLTVVIAPTNPGDAVQTGKGNATLGITKENAAGVTQEVSIKNPEEDDQWIVEVGPEISDVAALTTRAAQEPADWLQVYKKGDTYRGSKLYGTEDATILIEITKENVSPKPRQAEVTIKRALSGVTRIMVTQEKASAAIIEANSTQFAMVGGINQLTIVNPANTTSWKLSQTVGTEAWLSLVDESGQSVTTGMAGQVVRAVVTPNHTASVRTATISLSREGQDPVLVQVTQDAPLPMTVSANNFQLSYLSGYQTTLTIVNPEAAGGDFNWELSGIPSWLTVSPTVGSGGVTDRVTLTANTTNTSASARASSTLTLKRTGQADISIAVGQSGAPATTLSVNSIVADCASQTKSFNVSGPAGISWSLSSNQSWLTVSPASGSGNASVNLVMNSNTSATSTRTGVVTLTRTGQSAVTLTVVQNKAPVPQLTVTPKIQYGTVRQTGGYLYTYTIDVPAGVKWVATITDTRYPLYSYMTFGNGTKRFTGTGPGKIALFVRGYPYSSRGYTGAFNVTPDGGAAFQAGVILNP